MKFWDFIGFSKNKGNYIIDVQNGSLLLTFRFANLYNFILHPILIRLMSWVCLWSAIVAFSAHSLLLFALDCRIYKELAFKTHSLPKLLSPLNEVPSDISVLPFVQYLIFSKLSRFVNVKWVFQYNQLGYRHIETIMKSLL